PGGVAACLGSFHNMNASENSPIPGSGNQPEGIGSPSEPKPASTLQPPTRGQNRAALAVTILFFGVVVIGGRVLYVHSHRGGAETPGNMMTGGASGTPTAG